MSSSVRENDYFFLLMMIVVIMIVGIVNYHFLQSLTELMTLVILVTVYIIATRCYRYTKNHFSVFMGNSSIIIGIGYLIRIVFNNNELSYLFIKTMAYSGILLAEAFAFLGAPFFIHRKSSNRLLVSVFLLIILISFFLTRYFGADYVYRHIIEYSYVLIFILGIGNLLYHRKQLNGLFFYRVMGAMILLIGAAIIRIGPAINNHILFSNLLRFGAYVLVYQVTISLPFETIFREFKEKAIVDELTGLYNRQGLMEFAKKELARADREDWFIGVLLMDLDRFKLINDRHGHLAGDRIIQQFANILRISIRETDIICRLGGDEFVVMLSAKEINPGIIKDRILEAVEYWRSTNELAAKIGVSIGIGIKEPGSQKGLEEILKEADHNMYCDKNKKKPIRKKEEANQYKMFG